MCIHFLHCGANTKHRYCSCLSLSLSLSLPSPYGTIIVSGISEALNVFTIEMKSEIRQFL